MQLKVEVTVLGGDHPVQVGDQGEMGIGMRRGIEIEEEEGEVVVEVVGGREIMGMKGGRGRQRKGMERKRGKKSGMLSANGMKRG